MKSRLKVLFIQIMRMVTRLFRLMPLKQNRILFYAHGGSAYSDNPLCISDYLRINYEKKFEIIWQFKHPEQYQHLENEGIKVIGYRSFQSIYYCCTSKVIVEDHGPHPYFKRRPKQVIINTWHGGGAYKKIVFDEEKSRRFDIDPILYYTYQNVSIFISTNRIASEKMIRGGLHYNGEILECGMPRNDFLMQKRNDIKCCQIKKELGISEDKKILLYAPTWRYESDGWKNTIDFEALLKHLSNKWSGEWIILMRFHPSTSYIPPANTIDVSQYSNMQNLLYSSDILLTDYSSCMWDMSLMDKPVFLYVPDIDSYDRERGFYTDPYSWGFPLCKTMQELENAICDFDLNKYTAAVKKHHELLGICETGHATEQICERICKECEVKWKKNKIPGEEK